MKKLFAVLAGALLLSLLLTGIVLADPVTQDDITFEVNVAPSGVLPPAAGKTEEIIVTVVITNNTPNSITNIQLSIKGQTFSLRPAPPYPPRPLLTANKEKAWGRTEPALILNIPLQITET